MESRLHPAPRREKGQTTQTHCIGSGLDRNPVEPQEAQIRSAFALLAGTGLRIGEALALRPMDLGPDCDVLHVRRSLWRGLEQEPKTTNAVRVVDIPEVLASELRDYMSGITGYPFATEQGKPLQQRNLLRVLHKIKRVGFHAFRRFRLTWIRRNGAPKDIEHVWMGHAPQEVGDLYSKLKDNVGFRQEWAERIRTGLRVGPQWSTKRERS